MRKQNRKEFKKIERGCVELLGRVDYSDVVPDLVNVAPNDAHIWRWARHILSSAPWTNRPGRANFFFCVDRKSNGILGIVDIGSDLNALGLRDKYVGWGNARKFSGGLNHIANVGTCVSSHPFGLLTGGKFQLVACTSNKIVQLWQHRYGDRLAGITTTKDMIMTRFR